MSMNFYLCGALCFFVSIVLIIILMPFFIKFLKYLHVSQEVSEYALDTYKQKAKTPAMGGLLFVVIPVIVYAIFNGQGYKDPKAMMVAISFVTYCSIGFADDLIITIEKKNDGLSPLTKIVLELCLALLIYEAFKDIIQTSIPIPFTSFAIELGVLFLPFMILVYLSSANAVNFTDGMDGLCAGVSFIALIAFLIITFVNKEYNLALFILTIMGGLIGYLYYNRFPAKIFMGDSGSLALGALFAGLAIILGKEVAFIFIGGVFVWEMSCVVLQQVSVRLFHKRVFSYTPIHYAFVIKGNKETKVVRMFYIIAFVLMLVGLFIGLH